MIHEISAAPTPRWLSTIESRKFTQYPFPLIELLSGSLYYPACDIDGVPIKHLGGNVHSFVYVDYGVDRERIASRLEGRAGARFKGYNLVGIRDVNKEELVPNGWNPSFVIKEKHRYPQAYSYSYAKAPFALWSVFERESTVKPEHGPDRFSLLYIGGDGVATFDALYYSNKTSPRFIAIIQPGWGNWTRFEDETKIFGRLVLNNNNGIPEYLIYGGYGTGYTSSCWSTHSNLVCYLEPKERIGLWKRKSL